MTHFHKWNEHILYDKKGYPLGSFRNCPKCNIWQRWYCYYEGGDWFDCENPLLKGETWKLGW